MITGYFTEDWDLMNRGTDDQGRPMCHVRRVHRDGHYTFCTWRLVKRTSRNGIVGWYNVGQYLGDPISAYRPSPEKNGKKLSGSRIDLTLFELAERGYSTGWSQ